MTLAALLEELKQIDPETYHLELVRLHQPRNRALDHLQGCLQRACERHGWELEQNYRTRGRDGDLPQSMRHYAIITAWYREVHTYRGMGDTAAESLLAAYVAAVKEEEKDDR